MRSRASLVAVAGVLVACTGSSDNPGAAPGLACDPELAGAFSTWAAAGFSGSIAISTGGEFDCLAGYGSADVATGAPFDVDTVFSIGSVTKAFTAAAVFELVDDQRLALSDAAGRHIPELDGPVADATIEQLLNHTSGLVGSHGSDHEPLGRDAAVAAIDGLEQAFPPGSKHLYSNAGYTLLALIIEEASGQSYRDFLAARVLVLPDGHAAGGFWDGEPPAPDPRAVGYLADGSTGASGDFDGPHWALEGNGGLAMTTRELATWTRALFTGQVVSPASVDVIATSGFDNDDGTSERPGWVAFDESRFGEAGLATAGGGGDIGHNAVVVWLPSSDRVVAMASNRPAVTAEDLLMEVLPALLAGEPLPTPPTDAARDVDPAELAAIAGTYRLDTGGSLEVTAGSDQLSIGADGPDAVAALFALPDDVSGDDVTDHEERVLALLAGETREGREEREAVESDVGPIDAIELAGTIFEDGELRTYVTVASGATSTRLWYALDEEGGIAAVEIVSEPPALLVVPVDGDAYRGVDPTGRAPLVTITFADGRMTVTGPTSAIVARRAT